MIIKAPQKFSVFAYKYGYARTTSYEYVFDKNPAEEKAGDLTESQGHTGQKISDTSDPQEANTAND